MGICCCKRKVPDEEDHYERPTTPISYSSYSSDESYRPPKVLDPATVDRLILEMLSLISSFIDNDEDSPVSLIKLNVIADKEDGWIQVVSSMANVIPLEDPFGPSAITILFDDCPLPSKNAVIKVTKIFGLSAERASRKEPNPRVERNLCVILGCIAEKLAGPNSVAVLTDDTLDYLLTFLKKRHEACVVLFALVALEKFAHTTENKLIIKARLAAEPENPLLVLEKLVDSEELWWRQVGFCAQWALDNLFMVEGRKLSYEVVDMSAINVVLNANDVSEYLKISCNGLEARCDSYSFESVRSTFQVDEGCWYYESLITTSGVMQIGWATKHSHYLNHEGFGIGDDAFSIAYDGCRRLVWHGARPKRMGHMPVWKPGDVLGCLIDITLKEVVFSLNGVLIPASTDIFKTTKSGYFAAASFMAFQHCRFNFGHEPFRYPPSRQFACFNDHGRLTDEQKMVLPRRIFLEKLLSASVNEDACTICYDETASCILMPCLHRGFCPVCTAQLKECPMCRGEILNIRCENA